MTSVRALQYAPRSGPPTLDLDRVPPPRPLTPRERQVLALVAQGATDREIARDLSISIQTVKNYACLLRAKLDVSTRTELAAVFYGAVPYCRRPHPVPPRSYHEEPRP